MSDLSNNCALDALVISWAEQLRARGVCPEALDESVHEVFGDIGATEANEVAGADPEYLIDGISKSASDANNGGLEDQIRILILYHGVEEARLEIAAVTYVFLDRTVH